MEIDEKILDTMILAAKLLAIIPIAYGHEMGDGTFFSPENRLTPHRGVWYESGLGTKRIKVGCGVAARVRARAQVMCWLWFGLPRLARWAPAPPIGGWWTGGPISPWVPHQRAILPPSRILGVSCVQGKVASMGSVADSEVLVESGSTMRGVILAGGQ